MTWKAEHGIASCITICQADGTPRYTAIWMSYGIHWSTAGRPSVRIERPEALPDYVVAYVQQRFEDVFKLHISDRGAFCFRGLRKIPQPEEVE